MLHVLLILLKILLWLIAGILGLVILLLVCVLFCPIRYRAEGSYHGGKTAHVLARLHYLIFSVRFLYDQGTGTVQPEFRILWFRLGKKKQKTDKTKEPKVKQNPEPNRNPEETESTPGDIPIIEIPPEHADEIPQTGSETDVVNTEHRREHGSSDTDIRMQTDEHTDTESSNHTSQKPDAEEPEQAETESAEEIFDLDDRSDLPKKEQRLLGRLRILLQRLRERIKRTAEFVQTHTPDIMAEKISAKVEAKTKPLKKKLRRLKKFWNLRCTEKTRAYLKTYIPGLFRHILPRKVKGRIHYGMEEPYKTGQITGYLSLLPFLYQKGLSVEPDFEQKVLEIDLKLAGHFTLAYVLRIALNINIWRTIKAAKKVMNNGGTN